MGLKYKRILLKLSGEALAGERGVGLDFDVITPICESIKKCVELGAEVAIVVGGGNFWRGRSSGQMDRTKADHMGMLATVINAIAVCDTLEHLGVEARVQSAIAMPEVAELFIKDKAVRHLKKGREKELGVMDSTSAAMCRDNGMPVLVFSLEDPDNIVRAITGENIGTLVVG